MWGRFLTRIFALFGMTLTCVACYGTEYVEFEPDLSASGRVVDTQDNPIEGIAVSMGGEPCYTNPNGRFYVTGSNSTIAIIDIDGEENGGQFEAQYISMRKSHTDLGNVVLKRVGEESVNN